MYTVCVRDHFMIAHSLAGEQFGPAQRLHGATYVVDVEFRRRELGADGIVVDIGRAGEALHSILGELNYRNLDEEETFADSNTTTESLAFWIFERMRLHAETGGLGEGSGQLASMRVTLRESHVAWASYERDLV